MLNKLWWLVPCFALVTFIVDCHFSVASPGRPWLVYNKLTQKEDGMQLDKGPTIILYWWGVPFLRLANNLLLKSNTFQTIFFIRFCNQNNFLQPFKNFTGFFIDLIWNKHFLCMHTHEKSHLNETNSPWINVLQYGGRYSIWKRHIINKVEGIWYRCVTLSVWRRCIMSTVEGMQYGPVTPSIQIRVCSIWLLKLLKG